MTFEVVIALEAVAEDEPDLDNDCCAVIGVWRPLCGWLALFMGVTRLFPAFGFLPDCPR